MAYKLLIGYLMPKSSYFVSIFDYNHFHKYFQSSIKISIFMPFLFDDNIYLKKFFLTWIRVSSTLI